MVRMDSLLGFVLVFASFNLHFSIAATLDKYELNDLLTELTSDAENSVSSESAVDVEDSILQNEIEDILDDLQERIHVANKERKQNKKKKDSYTEERELERTFFINSNHLEPPPNLHPEEPFDENGNDIQNSNNPSIAGDMELTLLQKSLLGIDGETEPEQRALDVLEELTRRKILTLAKLWPGGIVPWTFSQESSEILNSTSKNKVKQAIVHWEENTCLSFPERSSEPNYIIFRKSSKGCSSSLGMVGKQYIKLDESWCFKRFGTVVHEIGHAIGLAHEQCRTDRGKEIIVRFDNIKPGKQSQYRVQQNAFNLAPYDLASDMHYGLGKSSKPSIVVRDKLLKGLPGSRLGLTFYDTMAVSKAYKCAGTCPNPGCQSGGFIQSIDPLKNENRKCFCKCPDGLAGDRCEKPDKKESMEGCGGVYKLKDGETVLIKTPNFKRGEKYYKKGDHCVWYIETEDASRVLDLTFEQFNIKRNGGHCAHSLEVRYNLPGQEGILLCGKGLAKEIEHLITEHNTLMLKFQAFSEEPVLNTGFIAKVKSIEVPGCLSDPCENNGVCTDNEQPQYICKCKEGFSGKNCDVYSGVAPIKCTFDDYTNEDGLCFINQDKVDDNFDWVLYSGKTRQYKYGTGPPSDQSGLDKVYIYAEARYHNKGEKAILLTTYFTGKRCLKFYYYMRGTGMGSLSVYSRGKTGPSQTNVLLWEKRGAQGDKWLPAEVSLNDEEASPYQIVFEASVGLKYSDIALDTVSVTTGLCSNSSLLPTEETPVDSFSCTFEKGMCGLVQDNDDNFDWTKRSGSTASSRTGPSSDHSGSGFYIYIETSKPRAPGDIAKLHTPLLKFKSGRGCLSFWYYSYGSSLGALRVSTTTNSKTDKLWHDSRKSEQIWKEKKINIENTELLKVVFEGVVGDSFRGDYALDDINIVEGTCQIDIKPECICEQWSDWADCTKLCDGGQHTKTRKCTPNIAGACKDESLKITEACNTFKCPRWCAWEAYSACTASCGPAKKTRKRVCNCPAGSTSLTCQGISSETVGCTDNTPCTSSRDFSCTFDKGTCGFKQDTLDDFNWTRNRGKTKSYRTGPSSDHTTKRGYYMYIETSNPIRPGWKARLISPTFTYPSGKGCLRFWYHSYGDHLGTLRAIVSYGGKERTIWQTSGPSVDKWQLATEYFETTKSFKIIFEGVKGRSYKSDFAIDDIKISPGKCQGKITQPVTQPKEVDDILAYLNSLLARLR